MTEPRRIQRKRTKGWRMPENTVYVGRGSRWGNPWRVSEYVSAAVAVEGYRLAIERCGYRRDPDDSEWHPMPSAMEVREDLAGKNLACWCKEGEPCHADVLLGLANR